MLRYLVFMIAVGTIARADFKSQVVKPVDEPVINTPPLSNIVTPGLALGDTTGATAEATSDQAAPGAGGGGGGGGPSANPMSSMPGMGGGDQSGAPVTNPDPGSNGQPFGTQSESSTPSFGDIQAQSFGPGIPNPAQGTPVQVGHTLSCQRDGAELCEGVKFDLAEPVPDFAAMPSQVRGKAFIDWLAPAARYIQATTGFPASMILTMAAHETAFGTSAAFKNQKNLFGHSCWEENQLKTGEAQFGTNKMSFNAQCGNVRRGDEKSGFYLTFKNHEEALIGYIYNLMHSEQNYNALRSMVRSAQGNQASPVASGDQALKSIIPPYASDQRYVETAMTHMNDASLGIRRFESDTCAQCVRAQQLASGAGPSGTAPTPMPNAPDTPAGTDAVEVMQ